MEWSGMTWSIQEDAVHVLRQNQVTYVTFTLRTLDLRLKYEFVNGQNVCRLFTSNMIKLPLFSTR